VSRLDIFGIGRQTAGMGTKVTTMTAYPPVEDVSVDTKRDELTIEETIGNRGPTGLDYGTRHFEIDVKCAPRFASLPKLLEAFAGQATAGVHDIMAASKIPEWVSMFVVRKDPATPIVDLFWDARGEEFSLTCAPNDYLKGDFKFIALDLDDTQAAPTPTPDLGKRWKFSQVIVYVNLNAAGEVAVKCRDATVTFGNNLDTDEAVLGDRKLYNLPYGNLKGEVKFSPRETLNAYYREALKADPTTTTVRLSATNGTNTIEANVKACEFIDAPAKVDGGEVLKMIEISARAKYDSVSGQFMTFTLS
jgi:hypothetical protein